MRTVQVKRPLWKRWWTRSTLQVSLIVAITAAIYSSMDNYTMHNLIVGSDRFTSATVYLVVGGWIGLLLALLLTFTVGKVVEPDFKGIVVRNKEMQRSAFLTGVISAGSMLFLLLGNQVGDPSFILALSQLSVIYIAIWEILKTKEGIRSLLLPILVVAGGSMMLAYSDSLQVTFLGFLYVVLLSNTLTACNELVEQTGAIAAGALSMYLWRFFWLCTTGTAIALIGAALRGTMADYIELLRNSLQYIPFFVLTMTIVWFSNSFKLYMKRFNAVTIVMAILSVKLILGFPITLIVDKFQDGAFGAVPSIMDNPVMWTVRFIGGVLLILGVIWLRNKHPEMRKKLG